MKKICSCVTCIAFREQESQDKADLQNSNYEAKSYLKGTLQLIISSHERELASAMPYGQMWPHVSALKEAAHIVP